MEKKVPKIAKKGKEKMSANSSLTQLRKEVGKLKGTAPERGRNGRIPPDLFFAIGRG